MFEILLNAVKIITSKDFRESASSLLNSVKNSPEWQKNTIDLDASVSTSQKEKAVFISDLVIEKCPWLSTEAANAFRVCYHELTRNAFEHGSRSEKDYVKLKIEIASFSYISLTVINPKQRKFDPLRLIESNITALRNNPAQKRGRGLILVSEVSDQFKSVNKGAGINVVIYSKRVIYQAISVLDVVTIFVTSGLYNPSLQRRLITEASKYIKSDVIIDIRSSETDPEDHTSDLSTDVPTLILDLNDFFEQTNNSVILVFRGDVPIMPRNLVARNFGECVGKTWQSPLP